ncbi:hypothetical protein ZIOFF_007208 [Zingiber officinale]|uniref:CRAL-TRIO domain-containing protein n=1 Tax=Zingiber officinale TaxID=94328 RepID=A0A8J5IE47_ZINOF|nr:hypothetical protein ZIOFF_007208 [Zingiber officinale]
MRNHYFPQLYAFILTSSLCFGIACFILLLEVSTLATAMTRSTEKKEPKARVEEVLRALNRQAPLTVEQDKFCSVACVELFLRAKGDSVKKASKHLRAVLSWREAIGTGGESPICLANCRSLLCDKQPTVHLMAEEFSTELADGMAYVAGHDDEARPVIVFRVKQDYFKHQSQKSFTRFLVFTLEVAVSSMARFVDQFVLLFDASFYRSPKAFLNVFLGTLKVVSDYYPGRLHQAFVIDPPSLFSFMWKGVRPFVELSAVTAVVSSMDYDDSLRSATLASRARASSLRFDAPVVRGGGVVKLGGSTSSRFSVTVSHLNSLKPWYLSTTTTTSSAVVPTASPSLVGASPLTVRSFSFASPGAAGSMSMSARVGTTPPSAMPSKQQPRTPMPSFLQSPSVLFSFKKEGQASRAERERHSFLPFLKFYRRPYDEAAYRAKQAAAARRLHNKSQTLPPIISS